MLCPASKKDNAMIPDIKKILYATDLSKNAIYAFRYAVYLSQKTGAEIVILHVIEKLSSDAEFTLMTYLDKEDRRNLFEQRVDHIVNQIKNRLKTFCEKELKNNKAMLDKITAIEVCEGFPEEQILKKVKKFNCDAIVMGTHEKGITHTFLGSVAKRVLRRARQPVMIIPLPKSDTPLAFHDE